MIHAISISAADSLPLVLLVHGSPGSADAFLDYLADTVLSKKARLVTIDRPGLRLYAGWPISSAVFRSQSRIKLSLPPAAR